VGKEKEKERTNKDVEEKKEEIEENNFDDDIDEMRDNVLDMCFNPMKENSTIEFFNSFQFWDKIISSSFTTSSWSWYLDHSDSLKSEVVPSFCTRGFYQHPIHQCSTTMGITSSSFPSVSSSPLVTQSSSFSSSFSVPFTSLSSALPTSAHNPIIFSSNASFTPFTPSSSSFYPCEGRLPFSSIYNHINGVEKEKMEFLTGTFYDSKKKKKNLEQIPNGEYAKQTIINKSLLPSLLSSSSDPLSPFTFIPSSSLPSLFTLDHLLSYSTCPPPLQLPVWNAVVTRSSTLSSLPIPSPSVLEKTYNKTTPLLNDNKNQIVSCSNNDDCNDSIGDGINNRNDIDYEENLFSDSIFTIHKSLEPYFNLLFSPYLTTFHFSHIHPILPPNPIPHCNRLCLRLPSFSNNKFNTSSHHQHIKQTLHPITFVDSLLSLKKWSWHVYPDYMFTHENSFFFFPSLHSFGLLFHNSRIRNTFNVLDRS
jgi:hypothetical protein